MSCACCSHVHVSKIIVLISPGRVVIDGVMNQRFVRLGGVQEHRTVALKERVAAAAAVVIYYHDCWRDALFLTWEQFRLLFRQAVEHLCLKTTHLILFVSTAVGYIVDLTLWLCSELLSHLWCFPVSKQLLINLSLCYIITKYFVNLFSFM